MYDPTRLAALGAVAEAGSITRAAERLGCTAPALSPQPAKLEREAGAALLVRHHRGARLTGAGKLLVARARRVLDELERVRHELAQLTGLSDGTLRLGDVPAGGDPAAAGAQRVPPGTSRRGVDRRGLRTSHWSELRGTPWGARWSAWGSGSGSYRRWAAHRPDETAPATDAFRALLRGAFSRARLG